MKSIANGIGIARARSAAKTNAPLRIVTRRRSRPA
jgi:hypothetical protein